MTVLVWDLGVAAVKGLSSVATILYPKLLTAIAGSWANLWAFLLAWVAAFKMVSVMSETLIRFLTLVSSTSGWHLSYEGHHREIQKLTLLSTKIWHFGW